MICEDLGVYPVIKFVSQQMSELGYDDLDLGCSTILIGAVGSYVRGLLPRGTPKVSVDLTQARDLLGQPVKFLRFPDHGTVFLNV